MSDISDAKNFMSKLVKELDDGTFEVKCKHQTYILEEVNGDKFVSCRRMAARSNKDERILLLMKSIIEPKVNEMTFLNDIKASDLVKLDMAIVHIYGYDDFLQEEETEKQE